MHVRMCASSKRRSYSGDDYSGTRMNSISVRSILNTPMGHVLREGGNERQCVCVFAYVCFCARAHVRTCAPVHVCVCLSHPGVLLHVRATRSDRSSCASHARACMHGRRYVTDTKQGTIMRLSTEDTPGAPSVTTWVSTCTRARVRACARAFMCTQNVGGPRVREARWHRRIRRLSVGTPDP